MGNRLLVVDDMAHLKHYYANIVLNQNLYAPGLNYSCEPGTRLLLGTPYALLRREFLAWRNWKRKISEIARYVLVTMGGSDPDNATLGIVRLLQYVDTPGLEVLVIVGAGNPHAKSLEAAARQSPVPVRLVHEARNMPELMSLADVAISAGGSTAWELAFMGLPTIFLVLTDNQRPVAESLGSAGAALDLGWYSKATPVYIKKELASFMTKEKVRADMSRKVKKIIDGDGASRIVSIMLAAGGGTNADSLSGKQLGRMADS
jgi:UDP-2,4-diacetamido-2,4,6-trideoxy-beta-L-altropyranose hydrolase